MGNVLGERQPDAPQDGGAPNGGDETRSSSSSSSEYDSQDEQEFRRRTSETGDQRQRDAHQSFRLARGSRNILAPTITPNPATLERRRESFGSAGEDGEHYESDTSEEHVVSTRVTRRGDATYSSFRLHDVTQRKDNDDFEFLSPEEEPVIPKEVRKRATKALKAVTLLKPEEEPTDTCNCQCRLRKKDKDTEPPLSTLTPELKRASTQGWNMMKKVFFPSIPAVLQDLWVYTELGITLFAFIFGLIGLFPIEGNAAFQIVYLTLTIISIILALIDANIYFFQLGSCARGIRVCRKYIKKRKNRISDSDKEELENEAEDDDVQQTSWYRLSPKWKERLTTWFEIIRTIASELLLYPLVIFDLFDFVTGAGYQPESTEDRVNFSLFVVGGFYLILAVYIMRVFMVAGAMSSLLKIPLTKKQSSDDGGKYIDVIVKFCLHIIGQIVVHLMILVVVGAKIADENINPEMNASNASDISGSGMNSSSQSSTIRASAFLAVAIAFGGVIPLIGIIMFFVANYYWMQEFSIGFFVNLVALLQGQGFAETVFGGEGTAPSKELAQSFAERVNYKSVRKQLRRFKSPPFHVKFLHPVRVPLAGISCFIYGATLVIFIVSLALTIDENGIVSVAVFQNDSVLTATFVITTLCIIVANIHILVLFAIGVVALLMLSVIASPIIVLLVFVLTFIYLPLFCYIGARKLLCTFGVFSGEQRDDTIGNTLDVEMNPISAEKSSNSALEA